MMEKEKTVLVEICQEPCATGARLQDEDIPYQYRVEARYEIPCGFGVSALEVLSHLFKDVSLGTYKTLLLNLDGQVHEIKFPQDDTVYNAAVYSRYAQGAEAE